jgi:hypothetical protein
MCLKEGRLWGVLRKEVSVFESKFSEMLCLKP